MNISRHFQFTGPNPSYVNTQTVTFSLIGFLQKKGFLEISGHVEKQPKIKLKIGSITDYDENFVNPRKFKQDVNANIKECHS